MMPAVMLASTKPITWRLALSAVAVAVVMFALI
jgi:hypothetical protein